jgi:FkbM family methyltransferase
MRLDSRLLLAIARHLPRGYARVLKVAANRDAALQDFPIRLDRLPGPLRADLRENVFIPMYLKREIPHQRGLDLLAIRLLRPGAIVFDIGANVGYTAALFSNLCGTTGKVVAFEPSSRTFAYLSRTTEEMANVVPLNQALAGAPGTREFYVPEKSDLASFASAEGTASQVVETTTVDLVSGTYGQPTLMKVDVEGFEHEVFDGARRTLSSPQRPAVIFEACSREELARSSEFLRSLASDGYKIGRIRPDGTIGSVTGPGTNDYLAWPMRSVDLLGELSEQERRNLS